MLLDGWISQGSEKTRTDILLPAGRLLAALFNLALEAFHY